MSPWEMIQHAGPEDWLRGLLMGTAALLLPGTRSHP